MPPGPLRRFRRCWLALVGLRYEQYGQPMASDPRTAQQDPPERYEQVLLRRQAQVGWRGPGGSRTVTVETRQVIGSATGVDLVIPEPTVSRIHAELEPRDSGLWVRDLGSRNGTFVDGVRVECACVPEGGRVLLGGVALTVTYAAKPAAVALWPDSHFHDLVGRSAAMRELFARLARVAASDATVLIQGETGTGKELVARALHDASRRAQGPFVVVDCGALPETLLDAELFGHSRGAFTGAVASRAGSFEAANGGTIFLDEIGELPMALQPKLLRALEARAVRRLGENEHRPLDVRFISATHRNLRALVNARGFREDLYFRLAVLPVTVPPLRDRLEDVALLAEHFLPGGARGSLTPDLIAELRTRPWLGNVRELRNFIDRVTTLGAREALAMAVDRGTTAAAPPADATTDDLLLLPFKDACERARERFERAYVRGLLERHDRNVSAAASATGINRTYLHRLIRKYL
jgi:two-component system response regulator GlrR